VRTTVTLDPDVESLVKRAMHERGLSFKDAVNEAIRAGFGGARSASPPAVPVFDMGEPLLDVTKALRLAGELEDLELVKRLGRGA
jgi:hypothetical protein